MAKVETWARHIKNREFYEEIPPDLRAFYESDTGGGFSEDIYLIYCPEDERKRRKTSEKLLYLFDGAFFLIERTATRTIIRKRFAASHIQVAESGFVLLDAWMTVVGETGGRVESVSVFYNRVVSQFFERMVALVRMAALGIDTRNIVYDNSVSAQFARISYKYMNYTRDLVFQDESPCETVFQPQIVGRRFKVVRVALTNDHAMLLSRKELIQLTEGRGFVDRYGYTSTFFFRKYVDSVALQDIGREGNFNVSITSGPYTRSVRFDDERRRAVGSLLGKIRK